MASDAILRATGRPWSFWASELDSYGPALDHATRARRLAEDHPDLPGWWVQQITVLFERERGLREVGQTAKGYQVSCSRTLPLGVGKAWQRLLATPFLGRTDWREGARWKTPEADVEVRRVDPGKMLRWFWHDGQGRSTVEVDLQDRGDRCTLRFRHHGLPDAEALEHYRARWKEALVQIGHA